MVDKATKPTRPGGRLVASAVLGVALLLGAAWSIGPHLFEARDFVEALDSGPVREEAEAACAQMRTALAASDDPEARNRAVEVMVARIRALGPETLRKDRPAEAWLADWEALVAARRSGVDANGDGSFDVPERDGVRITRYMDDLVKDLRPCQVPEEIMPARGF